MTWLSKAVLAAMALVGATAAAHAGCLSPWLVQGSQVGTHRLHLIVEANTSCSIYLGNPRQIMFPERPGHGVIGARGTTITFVPRPGFRGADRFVVRRCYVPNVPRACSTLIYRVTVR
jgi:hypothetical protein